MLISSTGTWNRSSGRRFRCIDSIISLIRVVSVNSIANDILTSNDTVNDKEACHPVLHNCRAETGNSIGKVESM